jgi:uncharacterized protein YecE (DUF72 family)
MASAFVGETRLPKNFKRYARQFSFLELDCEPGTVPGKARLQSCRAMAPEDFVFSLLLPSRLASLETGPELEHEWKAALGSARLLRARWWVVQTPAEVRPTRKSREGLAALVARLKDGGMRVAWEPRGVWDEKAAGDLADGIGAVLVHDIAREVPRPGSVLYSRLLALGRGSRVSLSLADVVAQRVREYEEAFVVVEGQGAREIQQALGLAQDDQDLLLGSEDEGASDGDDDLDAEDGGSEGDAEEDAVYDDDADADDDGGSEDDAVYDDEDEDK